jgi:two-component system, cell cycle response regulator
VKQGAWSEEPPPQPPRGQKPGRPRSAPPDANAPTDPKIPVSARLAATAVTHPEMPAVRTAMTVQHTDPSAILARPEPETPKVYGFDDEDEITEVGIRALDFRIAPLSAPARDRAVLLRMDGVLAGQLHVLGKSTFRIGRHPKNDLRADDTGISRFHACIEWEADGHVIEDLDSRNGTFVGGSAVTRRRLIDGDWIQLGPRVGFRYSITDATQEELLQRLFESSTRDALTGTYNRKHFEERLNAEVAYGLRHNTEIALVLFDIDHFKRINDTHGHQIGDVVLRQVATTAARRLRTEDVLARFGGEEFAVILRGTSRLGAGLVAERLRSLVAALPAIVDGKPIPVTVSAGCASLECCANRSPHELVAAADRRLYLAKRQGRNRVVASD